MTDNRKSILFTSLVILFWGTSATAFKIALKYTSPYNLLFYSALFSTIIIFCIILIQKKWHLIISIKIKDIRLLALLGLLNPFGYYVVLFQAYDLLPGQIAMSLNYGWPIALTILSVPLLKQKISARQLAAIFISFCGVIIISGKGQFLNYEQVNMAGIFLALFSTVIWAVFWLLNVRNNNDAVVKLFFGFLFGTIYAWLFNLFWGDVSFPDYQAIGPVIYISFFEMGITFVLWLLALKYAPSAARIGNLIFITPFLSLLFLKIILAEQLYLSTFLGLILIISGILFQKKGPESGP